MQTLAPAVPTPLRVVVAAGATEGTKLLLVAGELDCATADVLGGVIEDLRADGRSVDVSLSEVTFADVPGMRPLWAACLGGGRPRVRITDASPAVRRLLDIVLAVIGPGTSRRPGAAGQGSMSPRRIA
jgi:hypothetical protein